MSNLSKHNKILPNTSHIEIKNIDGLIQQRSQYSKYLKPIGLADSSVYYYTKQAGFFGKKQQRTVFTFFQGLNTNPQNLSIFLRDMVNSSNRNSKQKLSKGQFIVYDMFHQNDCVIEISIPGNFQIYKIKGNKKQLISNKEIQTMFISSIIRSMYEKNLVWGKSYNLFGCKNMLEQFKEFMNVFLRVVEKDDITISEDFQHKCSIKGSHVCSILFDFIKSKRIVHHTIDIIEKQVTARGGYSKVYPKMLILLSQLYSHDGKYAKSLYIISTMLSKYQNDPYLLYYQAKYMLKLVAVHQALIIVNNIVQFNQFQIWCLAAELHIESKNYSEGLICLNHASKIAGKTAKQASKNIQIEVVYAEFQKLGKKYMLEANDDITQRPKLMTVSESPISIVGNVQEKFKSLLQNQYWRMGHGQKIIFNLLRTLRYRLQYKRFQQLLQNTFQQSKKQYPIVNFKCGMSQSMFIQTKTQIHSLKQENKMQKQQQQLPNFLKDESVQIQEQQIKNGNRNLSIIPQLQSVIENSQFQQKEKQSHKITALKIKKELNETFYKTIKALLGQSQIQKAQFQQNWAKVLPIFNKLRTAAKLNSFYVQKMFQILMKIQNHRSVIVLIAESLDAYEQLLGSKQIDVLPFWMQGYIFEIVEQKGLKFLNTLLQKMDFLDAAVIDTIQLAKNWKIKGCTF